ncbi:uncharacterized protein LOC118506353 [Anopheles stephensi]|uniref:uncharacterized protein LOC118506353 n=1 Tax=Anopheles stephensi TaxID=30069 RepID=UPI0016588EE6|nr:uncharacterized protein LOC118506353 [Anopheles stephensi]
MAWAFTPLFTGTVTDRPKNHCTEPHGIWSSSHFYGFFTVRPASADTLRVRLAVGKPARAHSSPHKNQQNRDIIERCGKTTRGKMHVHTHHGGSGKKDNVMPFCSVSGPGIGNVCCGLYVDATLV